MIDRNPASRAHGPAAVRPQTPTRTAEELARFLRHASGDPLFALWVLLATTGMHRGEALFADPDGQPIHPDVVTRRFKTLVRQSSLSPLRGPHDLRHTWASFAFAAGVHPNIVSDRLGHSPISITVDTYSHAIPSLDADAAATVASQLFINDEEVDG